MSDTAHDRAREWLIGRMFRPPAGTGRGRRHAEQLADRILDGCEVREEWGARTDTGRQTWFASEEYARAAIDRYGQPVALIRRYVITTPATEDTDA